MSTATAELQAMEAGRMAYHAGGMRAPALDPTVLNLIAGMPVGSGATRIFQAFTDGFDAETATTVAALLAGGGWHDRALRPGADATGRPGKDLGADVTP